MLLAAKLPNSSLQHPHPATSTSISSYLFQLQSIYFSIHIYLLQHLIFQSQHLIHLL